MQKEKLQAKAWSLIILIWIRKLSLNLNDLTLVVRSACLADSVRHNKSAAL